MTFEESWPEITRRLMRFLAARGVPDSYRDDIIQETGVRLFRTWHRVDPDPGVWGLARTIAVHAIVDHAQRKPDYDVTDLTQLPDDSDLEVAAIARFRLASVGRALTQMSSMDRRILLSEVGAASPPRLGRSATKMARLRARQRLRVMVHKPGSWGVLSPLSLRLRFASGRRFFERSLMYPPFAEGGIAVVVTLAVTLATLDLGAAAAAPFASSGPIGGPPGVGIATVDLINGSHRPVAARGTGVSPEAANADPVKAREEKPEKHWLRDDPLYAQETAHQAREDAEHLGGDAEQAAQDVRTAAQEFHDGGKEIAEELAKIAEEEARYAAKLARKEARYAQEMAEEETRQGEELAR